MQRAITIFVLVLLTAIALIYFTPLVSLPFALAIFFVTGAARPVVKKSGFRAVVGYSISWGVLATAFFAVVTFAASDVLYSTQIIREPAIAVDAANFGVMLTLVVLLANQISIAPFARRLLAIFQPVFTLTVFYLVTLFFDIVIRQQAEVPRQLSLEFFQQLTSWQYVDIVERTINAIPDSPLEPFQYGYEMFATSSGSAFSLMPVASLVLLTWTVINILLAPFGKRPDAKTFQSMKTDDGSAMRTAFKAVMVNLVGLGFFLYGVAMANDTLATGGNSIVDAIWGILLSILGLGAITIGPLLIFTTPFVWVTAFAMSSLRPSDAYLSARSRYA